MGTGDVDPRPLHAAANALWVIDPSTVYGPRPATRDPFVAWPPPGYVPSSLVFLRWSLSIADAVFSDATVTMTEDGVTKVVTIAEEEDGCGENTLVWHPHMLGLDAVTSDVTFVVEVRNIHVLGSVRDVRYEVIAFDPGTVGAPKSIGPLPRLLDPSPTPTPYLVVPDPSLKKWTRETTQDLPFAPP